MGGVAAETLQALAVVRVDPDPVRWGADAVARALEGFGEAEASTCGGESVFVFFILKACAHGAGARRYERVAVRVVKLTRGLDCNLVAVNLDVPHEPLHPSLEPWRGYRRVKENEGVGNGLVAIAMGAAPDTEAG